MEMTIMKMAGTRATTIMVMITPGIPQAMRKEEERRICQLIHLICVLISV